jgi:hypothetical protein
MIGAVVLRILPLLALAASECVAHVSGDLQIDGKPFVAEGRARSG